MPFDTKGSPPQHLRPVDQVKPGTKGGKMIQLHIIMTAKGYHPKEKFFRFGHDTKNFPSMKEAKKWIKEQYGKAKRVPMFIDLKAGGSKKIGYVISFRNADLSHYPVNKWIQQDWIEFREVHTVTP